MKLRRHPGQTLLLLIGLACTLCFSPFGVEAANAQQSEALASLATPRIVVKIDESHLALLKGNTRPEAKAAIDRGQVAAEFPMNNLILLLRRDEQQQAAFDAFVASQYQSSSKNFHHWLTPEEVGEKFGPAPADIVTISQWLQSRGFTVNDVAKNRLAIRFSGNAALVQSAFHVEIHSLQVNGESHIANMSDPRIPAALAPVVVGIEALHNFFPHPLHRLGHQVRRDAKTGKWQHTAETAKSAVGASLRAQPLFGTTGGSGSSSYPVEDITPYDFANIYNVLPLWNSSTPVDGTGQSIAIVGTSNINLADVATFRSSFGLPPNVPTVMIPDSSTDPGACGNPYAANKCFEGQAENTLDVEWAGAIAKNASIILVASSPGNGSDYTSDPVYGSADYIIQNRIAPIMNVSYGNCEAFLGTAGNAGFNALWQTAAAEGIAVFVATGDSGSPACDQGQSDSTPYAAQIGLSVSGVASTPYNTAVGGTDFKWGTTASPYWNTTNDSNGSSAVGYIPEVAWNQSCANPLAVASITRIAQKTGLGTVTDAESACNFIYNNYPAINNQYGVDVSSFIQTSGGGGGVSSCTVNDFAPTTGQVDLKSCSGGYAKPDWQTSLTPGDSKRDIPDVSFFASDGFLGSAYLICLSAPAYGQDCTYPTDSEPLYQEVGGTSVASPIMAGVMALINQKTGTSQGNPNAELYTLAYNQNYAGCSSETVTASSGGCIFNDVDSGTNAMPCVSGSPDCGTNQTSDALGVTAGYNAVQGYDRATGLGSANIANLVNNFPSTITPAAVASLTASSLTFPETVLRRPAPVQKVILQNTGNAALNISNVSILGTGASSFSETDNCVASLAVFASCTIAVTFNPADAGPLTATIRISDDASASSTQTIDLSGIGIAPAPVAALSPTSLSFPATPIGTLAASQTVLLKNTGTSALIVSSITITGVDVSSFSQTNTCSSVASGSDCVITVSFQPTASGALNAAISIADNASNAPQSVSLSGTGAAPSLPGTYTLAASATTIASAGLSGTSTVTATSSNGYVGTLTLTCALATAPAGANTTANPTCSVGDTIAMPGTGTAVLRIATTAPSSTTNVSRSENHSSFGGLLGTGGVATAGMMLFCIPMRRRRWPSLLAALLLFAALGVVSGCSGGSTGKVSQPIPGTTSGTYTYTVSGTGNDSATTKATTTLTVTVQ